MYGYYINSIVQFHHSQHQKMSTSSQTPQKILNGLCKELHRLNKATHEYLKYLTSCSSNPSIVSWQVVESVMVQLNQNTSVNDSSNQFERNLLLMNVMRVIVNCTFGGLGGFRGNRIYCWFGLLYACVTDQLIQYMHTILLNVSNLQQSPKQHQQAKKKLLKYICIGLLTTQIMLTLIENTNQNDTSNKVIYPEVYRLINFCLEAIQTLGGFNPYQLIPYEDVQRDADDTQDINAQDDQEKRDNRQNTEQNSMKVIRSTTILKILSQIQTKTSKKAKNNQKVTRKEQYEQVVALITAKIVQILQRSLSLCKIKHIKQVYLIKQINKILQNAITESINQQDENLQQNQQENSNSLRTIILRYLGLFSDSHANTSLNNQYQNQEIDEQNKIIQVKQLTPRFSESNEIAQLKKLRTKKKKLIKKIQSDARVAKRNKLQQQRVLNDVKNERVLKRQKKQIFILQKQTQQAKKQHNKMKRVKKIQKQGHGKGTKKAQKSKFAKK